MPEPIENRPNLLSMRTIGKLIGWRTRRVKRLLHRNGVGFKVGGRWYTTLSGLRRVDREFYSMITYEAERQSFDLAGYE